MIQVSVIGNEPIGNIDFFGVRVTQPDGSTKVETHDGKPVPFSFRCSPHAEEFRPVLERLSGQIAQMLASRVVIGHCDDYEWRVS